MPVLRFITNPGSVGPVPRSIVAPFQPFVNWTVAEPKNASVSSVVSLPFTYWKPKSFVATCTGPIAKFAETSTVNFVSLPLLISIPGLVTSPKSSSNPGTANAPGLPSRTDW